MCNASRARSLVFSASIERDAPDAPTTSARIPPVMRRANIVVTACAALLVFVVGGGTWFVAFSSLVFVLTSSLPVGYAVGAVTGVVFGGLVATPLARRLLRLLKSSS